MDYVTDTHPLVWYFTEDRRLSKKALATFEETIEQGLIIITQDLFVKYEDSIMER